MRRVSGKNQFGKFDIRIGNSLGLLVPTQKVIRGSVFPETLDHYKVYRVVQFEKVPTVTRKLQDQFVSETVRIGPPIGFAVPVSKTASPTRHNDPEPDGASPHLPDHATRLPEADQGAEPVCERREPGRGAERVPGGTEPEGRVEAAVGPGT